MLASCLKPNPNPKMALKFFLLGLFILVNIMNCSPTATPSPHQHTLPADFVYLHDFYERTIKPVKPHVKPIQEHLRYSTEENFTGAIVRGYHPTSRAVLTKQAAAALYKAQEAAQAAGYSLLIYDSYRPQNSVDRFLEWAKEPDNCSKCRRNYFPYLKTKLDAFKLPDRYVAPKSRHSGGSTVDLTLIKLNQTIIHPPKPIPRQLLNNQTVNYLFDGTLDMGTSFDLMHYASWPEGHSLVPETPYLVNRRILGNVMADAGFNQLPREWWHFTLQNEPFPEEYFYFEF